MDHLRTCLVCGKQEFNPAFHSTGWRFAANRIGGYVCGAVCDQVILDYDEAQKQAKKKRKVQSPLGPPDEHVYQQATATASSKE